jgi:hypothetical protein
MTKVKTRPKRANGAPAPTDKRLEALLGPKLTELHKLGRRTRAVTDLRLLERPGFGEPVHRTFGSITEFIYMPPYTTGSPLSELTATVPHAGGTLTSVVAQSSADNVTGQITIRAVCGDPQSTIPGQFHFGPADFNSIETAMAQLITFAPMSSSRTMSVGAQFTTSSALHAELYVTDVLGWVYGGVDVLAIPLDATYSALPGAAAGRTIFLNGYSEGTNRWFIFGDDWLSLANDAVFKSSFSVDTAPLSVPAGSSAIWTSVTVWLYAVVDSEGAPATSPPEFPTNSKFWDEAQAWFTDGTALQLTSLTCTF